MSEAEHQEQQQQQTEEQKSFTTNTATTKMKIRLGNLPKFVNASAVKQWIASQTKLPSDTIVCRKAPKWNHAFVGLQKQKEQEEQELKDLMGQLNGASWKKQTVTAKLEQQITKNDDTDVDNDRCLNDQVTPLWRMPYEEQLALKQTEMHGILETVRKATSTWSGLEPIKASPDQTGYRNKCEFSIGFDRAGEIRVGFSLGLFKEGQLAIESAQETLHVPERVKQIAQHFEEYLRGRGRHMIFDRITRTGLYRLLLVRIHNGQAMVAPQLQEGALTPEALETELGAIVGCLGGMADSLYLQLTGALFHGIDPARPFQHLAGQTFLHETVTLPKDHRSEEGPSCSFQISPHSFFQVNPKGTSVLYDTIREYVTRGHDANTTSSSSSSSSSDTTSKRPITLLDLCCGTGTIGIILAPAVSKVIGIEMVPSAVQDARLNASLNGLTQADRIGFECGKIEDLLPPILATIPTNHEIVVVLDPPRSGAHKSVIRTIRATSRISRVVYVSCNPAAALANFQDLGREASSSAKRVDGGHGPFELVRAVPVDMFPHTRHCELVLLFERANRSSEKQNGEIKDNITAN